MVKLQESEFIKLSELSGVSYADLAKIYAMGLLKESAAIDYLIRHDFVNLRRKKYAPSQIFFALKQRYQVSDERMRRAAYSKNKRIYYCDECNKVIVKSQYERNNGLCNECVGKHIQF